MTDHSIYMDESLTAFAQAPGFPYMRFSLALISPEDADRISSSEEQLLLAMHCPDSKLLVISNKHIRIYKIPAQKSFLRKAVSAGLDIGIGRIPVVGDVLDAVDDIKGPIEWVWNTATRKKAKERKADLARAAEGMPTKKELENLVWNFRDPNTLTMIMLYQDRILLRNGFEWKTEFEAPFLDTTQEPTEITVDSSGVRFAVGRKKAHTSFLGKDWSPLGITKALLERNQPALASAGWSVETGDRKFVLKYLQ